MAKIIGPEDFREILDAEKDKSLETRYINRVEFLNVVNYLADGFMDTIEKLKKRYPDYRINLKVKNNLLGDIGEEFFDNISWLLHTRGFSSIGNGNRTYRIVKHYGAAIYSARGGIDRRITIKDETGRIRNLAIEVKNWKWMRKGIGIELWQNDFLDRYKKCDEDDIKILVMNKRNKNLLMERCRKEKIIFIGLDQHITPEIGRDKVFYCFREFYLEMNTLINEIFYTDLEKMRILKKNGVEVKIIAKAFGYSKNYLYGILKKEQDND